MNTIKSLLTIASNRLLTCSDSAMLDAEVLLCHVLNKQRSYLRTWPEEFLTEMQILAFEELLQQRCTGIPVAYLTGIREFWSRDFIVTTDVLIPRPATECLIEFCLDIIPQDNNYAIADLGTGSGIIAVTLAAERPNVQIMASDFSLQALIIARNNANQYQLTNISFYQSDWFKSIPKQLFNLIISNPPYIAENDPHLTQGDVRFEPISALIANEQGLADIKEIASEARFWLKQEGHLLIEHGYNQQDAVKSIFQTLGYSKIKTIQDLSGQPRATYGQFENF